ncbi:hypothetical protein IAQ61_003786 [Plenodomus lingam]|uniref:uncharacterized protein n=1 Tax=Leptosphaeria maculans TaxID=5022 RepID=UPI003321B794|nr:hypothetical protein IAQ61_003786 [Plenodomus lingam]
MRQLSRRGCRETTADKEVNEEESFSNSYQLFTQLTQSSLEYQPKPARPVLHPSRWSDPELPKLQVQNKTTGTFTGCKILK